MDPITEQLLLKVLMSAVPSLLAPFGQRNDPTRQRLAEIQQVASPQYLGNTAQSIYRTGIGMMSPAFNDIMAGANVARDQLASKFSGPVTSRVGDVAGAIGSGLASTQIGMAKAQLGNTALERAMELIRTRLGGLTNTPMPTNYRGNAMQGGWDALAPSIEAWLKTRIPGGTSGKP